MLRKHSVKNLIKNRKKKKRKQLVVNSLVSVRLSIITVLRTIVEKLSATQT